MIEELKSIKGEIKDFRNFGIIGGAIALTVAGLFFWKENNWFLAVLGAGTFLLVCGMVLPYILKPFYRAWMIFALALGWIMTRVFLCLLFYGIFTPIGTIARAAGKQFLDLKWDKTRISYWNDRSAEQREMTDYEKQF